MGAGIHRGRFTASMPDEFVVFLIGMRFKRPVRVDKWFPVFIAMPKMLRWLDKHPQAGLLKWHFTLIHGPAIVQYVGIWHETYIGNTAANEPALAPYPNP